MNTYIVYLKGGMTIELKTNIVSADIIFDRMANGDLEILKSNDGKVLIKTSEIAAIVEERVAPWDLRIWEIGERLPKDVMKNE